MRATREVRERCDQRGRSRLEPTTDRSRATSPSHRSPPRDGGTPFPSLRLLLTLCTTGLSLLHSHERRAQPCGLHTRICLAYQLRKAEEEATFFSLACTHGLMVTSPAIPSRTVPGTALSTRRPQTRIWAAAATRSLMRSCPPAVRRGRRAEARRDRGYLPVTGSPLPPLSSVSPSALVQGAFLLVDDAGKLASPSLSLRRSGRARLRPGVLVAQDISGPMRCSVRTGYGYVAQRYRWRRMASQPQSNPNCIRATLGIVP